MVSSGEILAAFREVSNSKQLDRAELYALLQDGILAALAKKYGPNVQAEVNIDDGKGDIRIVLLKTVVETVEDSSREISIDDARTFDESFEAGDVMEEPIDFAVFGRAAVQAAKQRIIQRVRESALQARGSRDSAEHCRDSGGGSRSRQPHQDRGVLSRRFDRPGRRVRGAQGLAGAGGRQRVER